MRINIFCSATEIFETASNRNEPCFLSIREYVKRAIILSTARNYSARKTKPCTHCSVRSGYRVTINSMSFVVFFSLFRGKTKLVEKDRLGCQSAFNTTDSVYLVDSSDCNDGEIRKTNVEKWTIFINISIRWTSISEVIGEWVSINIIHYMSSFVKEKYWTIWTQLSQ